MALPIYSDFMNKYNTGELFERNPYRITIPESSYLANKPRFISIPDIFASLYEDGLISYIRTDCPVMDIEQFQTRFMIFESIGQSFFNNREIMQLLTRMDVNLMKPDCWVDSPPFAHGAISPTVFSANVDYEFNARDKPYQTIRKNMYLDVCKAYIKLFIPD